MKKLLFTLAVLLPGLLGTANVLAQAKIKVLESSQRKSPVWVGASERDYIVTSAIAADMETAKNQAMEDVRKQIIRAVAENVQASSQGSIDQQVINNEIVSFLDTFTSDYQTQSANIPYLKGISSSKVEAYYWEKRQDKQTKEITWLYAVKYPFPETELRLMVRSFEKRDAEIYNKYLALEEALGSVSSLEQIDRAITDLNPIIAYFFDSTRKDAARALQLKYRNLYNSVSVRAISDKLGEHRFALMLEGRPITTSQRMTARSDDATDVRIEQHGQEVIVKYDFTGAEYDVQSSVTVNMKIGGKSVPYKFMFIVKKSGVLIWPEKIMYLTAETVTDSLLSNIVVRMTIRSEHSSPFTVKSLTLDVPGLSEPLFLDMLNQTFDRKEATLYVTYMRDVRPLRTQAQRANMLRGNMVVEIPEEQIEMRVDFSLPFRANW